MTSNPDKQTVRLKVNRVRIGDASDAVVSQHTLTWLKPARRVCDYIVKLDFSEYFIDGVGVEMRRYPSLPDTFFPTRDPDHVYQVVSDLAACD